MSSHLLIPTSRRRATFCSRCNIAASNWCPNSLHSKGFVVSHRFWPMERGHIITSPFGPQWGTLHAGVDFGWDGGSANRADYECASTGGTTK